MIHYQLDIASVDMETSYIIETQDRKLLRPFLKLHDDEGSTVYLDILYDYREAHEYEKELRDEEVYEFLDAV
jgi:hypothetical protein